MKSKSYIKVPQDQPQKGKKLRSNRKAISKSAGKLISCTWRTTGQLMYLCQLVAMNGVQKLELYMFCVGFQVKKILVVSGKYTCKWKAIVIYFHTEGEHDHTIYTLKSCASQTNIIYLILTYAFSEVAPSLFSARSNQVHV